MAWLLIVFTLINGSWTVTVEATFPGDRAGQIACYEQKRTDYPTLPEQLNSRCTRVRILAKEI